MKIQRSSVQIAPGQDNVSILARSLALHYPCGIRRTHQTIGTGNLVKWVGRRLFAQMVNIQCYIPPPHSVPCNLLRYCCGVQPWYFLKIWVK